MEAAFNALTTVTGAVPRTMIAVADVQMVGSILPAVANVGFVPSDCTRIVGVNMIDDSVTHFHDPLPLS